MSLESSYSGRLVVSLEEVEAERVDLELCQRMMLKRRRRRRRGDEWQAGRVE